MTTLLSDFFAEMLTSEGTVIFADRTWAKKLDTDYRQSLAKKVKPDNYFEFDLKHLTKKKLVRDLINQVDLDTSGETSNYRILIDALSELGSGVIVFYRSHLVSSDVLHLLSRIIRNTQRHNLKWKFILFGQADMMDELDKAQLFVDQFYPVGSEHESTSSSSQNGGISWQKVFATTLAIGLICVFLFLMFVKPNTSSVVDLATEQEVIGIPQNDVDELKQVNYDQSEVLQDLIRQSKLRDLEFKGILARIDSDDQPDDRTESDELVNVQASQTSESSPTESLTTEGLTTASQDKSKSISRTLPLTSELEQAILSGNIELVKTLSDATVLAYARNDTSETPLIIAVNNGNEQITAWLLKQNAPVDSKDDYGRSALFYAAINGNEALISRLIRAGAKTDLGSNLFKTPLMAAVHNNHYLSAQKLLLTNTAKVNATDHSGWSALFYAVWNKNTKMAKLLIEHGADRNIVDNSGLSIKQVAVAAGFDEAQDFL